MNKITKLKDLKEGDAVFIHSVQFNATNLCRLVSHDTLGLDRDIAYFQFADRGFEVATKAKLIDWFHNGINPVSGIFAVWGHDLAGASLGTVIAPLTAHYRVSNIDNVVKFFTEDEFLEYVYSVSVENEDLIKIKTINAAVEYIKTYCPNLDLKILTI